MQNLHLSLPFAICTLALRYSFYMINAYVNGKNLRTGLSRSFGTRRFFHLFPLFFSFAPYNCSGRSFIQQYVGKIRNRSLTHIANNHSPFSVAMAKSDANAEKENESSWCVCVCIVLCIYLETYWKTLTGFRTLFA